MFYLYFSAKLLKVKMWFLIPLKNWAFKVVLFSSICWFAYEIFVPLLNPTERLLVSGAIVGLSSLLLIRYELRKSNRG
jgi:hypothetical protein